MKKIKIISVFIIIIILIIALMKLNNAIKDNDDWAPHIIKTYNDKYTIQSNIYELQDIKKEMTEFVNKYKEGLKLTYVQYRFEKENEGTVKFEFFKNDEYQKSTVHKFTIVVNMETKEIDTIVYEKGHGKRINPYSNEINLNENILNYKTNGAERFKITIINDKVTTNVSIIGLVELHHNGFIYIFGGQHFGELGYEIEEYATSNIDDTNQTCIDYFTSKEYDTSYIEEGDLIICTGDFTKKESYNNDFKTTGAIVVLKSADYDQMKKDAITGNRTVEATITAGDIYKEEGYMYLKYDIEDDTNSDTAYHFPFIKKVNISDNTEIIGDLQKGNRVQVEYENLSEPLGDLELKSIEVIN